MRTPLASLGVLNVEKKALAFAIAALLGGCTQALSPLSMPTSAIVQRVDGPPISETPMQADAFVDSIGVNTHLFADLTNDGEYAIVTRRMRQLGVRHVRDEIYDLSDRQFTDERKFLDATGAKMEAIGNCRPPLGPPYGQTPPSLIRLYDEKIGGNIELMEGPNEPDVRGVAHWGSLTVKCIRSLHLNATLPVPFVAPAMAFGRNAPAMGDIARLVDVGAIHRYFTGWNPGWPGYGSNACGRIGSLPWAICEAKVNSGTAHPLYVTETGYSTSGTFGNAPFEVNEVTEGKYLSRVLLVDSIGGIARTYIYELHDDGHDTTPFENGYGLIRYDGSPKPGFDAVRSEIELLRDPGPAFAPRPLAYGLILGAPSIEHELFQKRNGTYVIALWNETAGWVPGPGGTIAVPAKPVTVILPAAPRDLHVEALDDRGRLVSGHARLQGTRVTIPVDDHVSFLSFRSSTLVDLNQSKR